MNQSNKPLDPSKVKAGDTVTLERGVAVVKGEVSTAYPPVPDSEHVNQYVAFSLADVGGSMFVVGGDHPWTLTDHQPAPEPEPEWKPGTVAEATVRGAKGIRVIRATNTGGSDPHEMDPTWISADLVDRGQKVNGYDGTYLHHDDDVTDVRPLVVIDPATVDWRGLQSQMSVLVVGVEPFKRAGDILGVVRRELGIEAS